MWYSHLYQFIPIQIEIVGKLVSKIFMFQSKDPYMVKIFTFFLITRQISTMPVNFIA